MTTAAEFQEKVTKAVTNMDRLDGIVNGDTDAVVETDHGDVPSLAKAIAGITVELETQQFQVVTGGRSLSTADRSTPSLLATEVADPTGSANCGALIATQAARSAVGEILFPAGTFKVNVAATWPRGVQYRFMEGSVITVDGVALDIRGVVNAGDYKIFNCINGGSVVGIRSVNAAWWGLSAGSLATGNSQAIQAMHDCAEAVQLGSNGNANSDGMPVFRIPSGRWYLRNKVHFRPTALFSPKWDTGASVLDGTQLVAAAAFADGDFLFDIGTDTVQITDFVGPGCYVTRQAGASCFQAFRFRNTIGQEKRVWRGLYVGGLEGTGDSFTTAVAFRGLWSLVDFQEYGFWLNSASEVKVIDFGTVTGGDRPADVGFSDGQSVVYKPGDFHLWGRTNGGGLNGINLKAGALCYGGQVYDFECLGPNSDEIGDIFLNPGFQCDSMGPKIARAHTGDGQIYNISHLGHYATNKAEWHDATKSVIDIKLTGDGSLRDIQVLGLTITGFAGIAVDAFGWKAGSIGNNRFRHIGDVDGDLPAVISASALIGTRIHNNTYNDNDGVGSWKAAAFVLIADTCHQIAVEQNWGGGEMPSVVDLGATESYIQGRDDAAGKADVSLANVTPATGRAALGLAGELSIGDIPTGLSNAAYTDAFEAMLQDAADNDYAVYIPPGTGNGLVNRTMNVSGMVSIYGVWGLSQIRTTGLNAPAILINITEPTETPKYFIGGFEVFNDIATVANEMSAAVAITGDALLTYVHFSKIKSTGFYCTFKNMMGTTPSDFGVESYLNNCAFDNIWTHYHPDCVNAKYGVWHTNGSGTGNEYRNFKGNIARRGRRVASVTMSAAGSLYTLPPVVTVTDPTSELELTPIMGTGGAAGTVVGLTITTPGYLRPTDTIVFTRASGDTTGTGAAATFTRDMATSEAELPAHLRIDGGVGVVCGDILADGTITALDAAMISCDGTMNYLANIIIGPMSQVDAQARAGIRFDPLPANSTYGISDLSAKGGEIDVSPNFKYLQGSRIWHQGYGEQQAGVARNSIGAYGQPVIGYVILQNYSAMRVNVNMSALVQGVGAGGVAGDYIVVYGDSGNATVTAAPSHPWASTSFTAATINHSASGRTVTFFGDFVGAASGGNQFDGQLEGIGGRGLVKRASA